MEVVVEVVAALEVQVVVVAEEMELPPFPFTLGSSRLPSEPRTALEQKEEEQEKEEQREKDREAAEYLRPWSHLHLIACSKTTPTCQTTTTTA